MVSKHNDQTVSEILRIAKPADVAERLGMVVVRRGAQSKALCPFHPDTEPSLVLYDESPSPNERPHFHCYSCNAHGDVFHLVQQVKQIDFLESVAWLADSYRITRGKAARGPAQARTGAKAPLGAVSPNRESGFERALAIYRSRNGTTQVLHWLKERTLPALVLESGELAYAHPGTLTGALQDQAEKGSSWRIDQGLLEECGLIRQVRQEASSKDLYFDLGERLRDFFSDRRVLFPIRDSVGGLIGFAGRLTGDNSDSTAPKYLFTPKLPRGNVLYRSHVAWKQILDRTRTKTSNQVEDLYVCEGLVDALRLESLGLSAVALLGAQATGNQVAAIKAFSDKIASQAVLRCHIFLDRDEAGIRGAARLALLLAEAGIESSYIWPTSTALNVLGVSKPDQKDPDSIFKDLEPQFTASLLADWQRPSVLAIVASKLQDGITPDDIVDDARWQEISLSRRFRAADRISRDARVAELLLDVSRCSEDKATEKWLLDLRAYRSPEQRQTSDVRLARAATYIDDTNARLNHARALAKSGAERGEVPSDEASWRRIDVGATAFNEGFRARLASDRYKPLEPFDSVLVARDFGNPDPRLKAMPCPEDLVAQQCILADLLTERFDSTTEGQHGQFSTFVPAVRYFGETRSTETTAEDSSFERYSETLSFAYQIDMDVLEGRRKASSQGMFRPYIDCWHEFIDSLRGKAEEFGMVYAVRLDLKRYYDRLSRSTIRDTLRNPLNKAVGALGDRLEEFVVDFSTNNRQNLGDKIVDWFCEQSFDFEYYNTHSGKIDVSLPSLGIPQGPVLSAWLATVALFPLDSALRAALKSLNGQDGNPLRVAYARYVDDIFLIAATPDALQVLRAVAEDAAKALRLELVQKGDVMPKMTSEEFRELLAEGKAFVGSGPARELGLLHLGDGEAGYATWHDADLRRSSSLELLSDRRLYLVDDAQLKDQLYTALQAPDLRPGELPKVSRWIWYSVSASSVSSSEKAWDDYWEIWRSVTAGVGWVLDPRKRPWEDPALYALDGLERMLSSANIHDVNLLPEEEETRRGHLRRLAVLALDMRFIEGFVAPTSNAPDGTGAGVRQLPRMFLQRCVCIRWIALQLIGASADGSLQRTLPVALGQLPDSVNSSLTRAWLTDLEISGGSIAPKADQGESPDFGQPIRRAFIWLHHAIVQFGRTCSTGVDPLDDIAGDLRINVIQYAKQQQKDIWQETSAKNAGNVFDFLHLLELWLPNETTGDAAGSSIGTAALSSLLSVCHRDNLIPCLGRRRALLHYGLDGRHLLPPLPGIPAEYLVMVRKEPLASDSSHWRKIGKLSHLQLASDMRPGAKPHDLIVATDSGTKSILPLEWKREEFQVLNSDLACETADWQSSTNVIACMAPPPLLEIRPAHLKWAAAVFERLATINGDASNFTPKLDGNNEPIPLEFVPAWPYVAFTSSGSSEVREMSGDFSLSLIGPVVQRAKLGGSAFFREGKGRIKTHEVPIADAWLWRIGYAVTDLLGLADELDRFRELDLSLVREFHAAEHILHAMLRRLRGNFASAGPLPRHATARHLPATVFRALQLLRNFPEVHGTDAGLSYALAVEIETRGMQARITGEWDFSRAGESAAFLERTVTSLMTRLPARWAAALPTVSARDVAIYFRRSVSAWDTLIQRVDLLPAPNIGDNGNALPHRGWSALKAGLRLAAITAWLRSLAFELETDNKIRRPESLDPPEEWKLVETSLGLGSSNEDLLRFYGDALKKEGNMSSLRAVTPLGWLTLIVARLKLYDDTECLLPLNATAIFALREQVSRVAKGLAAPEIIDVEQGVDWPFEGVSAAENLALDEGSYDSALATLRALDEAVGFRVRAVESEMWGLTARLQHFVDSEGKSWKLTKSLIQQLPRDKHVEEKARGRKIVRTWTETRTAMADLVGVSVLGLNFAKWTNIEGTRPEFVDHPDSLSVARPETSIAPSREDASSQKTTDTPIASARTSTELTADKSATEQPATPRDLQNQPGTETLAIQGANAKQEVLRSTVLEWEREQRQAWQTARRNKAGNHVRIALIQFRVDDSYLHPLLEVGMPDELEQALDKPGEATRMALRAEILARAARGEELTAAPSNSVSKSSDANPPSLKPPLTQLGLARAAATTRGTEHQWTESALLPSWAEHRRRRLIETAIRTCSTFNVDVLVLPEYSVRPDTVAWLKDHLWATGSKVSVIAGTYRLHGDRTDLHFSKQFSTIFGLADKKEVLEASGRSADKAAFLTLLHPVELAQGHAVVTVFTRRKKYPSAAMGEIFNPPMTEWAPLLTIDRLIDYLADYSAAKGLAPLSVEKVIQFSRQFPAAERLAELICSELFLTTHPVNWRPIQDELKKLRARFGNSSDDASDSLRKDVEVFAEYLGAYLTSEAVKADRRTIIVVPAYTSRSADYWIYGQSALLAAGLTTVFCAAVAKDSKGGSCFIGKSSWSDEKPVPGLLRPNTPYSGWSHGIYYTKPTDALGETEQALVIADIDPLYMNEGRPRPQTLPVPIQLVAHLPIVESVDYAVLKKELAYLTGVSSNENITPETPTKEGAAPSGDAIQGHSHLEGTNSNTQERQNKTLKLPFDIRDVRDVEKAVAELLAHVFVINPNTPKRHSLLDPSTPNLTTGKSPFEIARQFQWFFADKSPYNLRLDCWKKNWLQLPFYGPPPAVIDWLWVDLTPRENTPTPKILVPPWRPDDGRQGIEDTPETSS